MARGKKGRKTRGRDDDDDDDACERPTQSVLQDAVVTQQAAGDELGKVVIVDDTGQRLDQYVAKKLSLTRTRGEFALSRTKLVMAPIRNPLLLQHYASRYASQPRCEGWCRAGRWRAGESVCEAARGSNHRLP